MPYRENSLPGLLIHAHGDEPQPPMVVHLNGLDSTKEMIYGTGIAREYARRGISTLIVDQPGSGESLRLRGIPGIVESERYGTACLDYLLSRGDCDPDRIGIAGWSLGGYFAPRVAAYEPRFAFCVAWGAIYDWGALQRRRQQQLAEAPAERSVPRFWEHVLWTFGQTSVEGLARFTARMNLVEDSRRIRMPFLVLHGSNDRQVPVEMARRQYDAAVNSVRRELKIMTEHDGGVEHVAADNIAPTITYIADWVADVASTRSDLQAGLARFDQARDTDARFALNEASSAPHFRRATSACPATPEVNRHPNGLTSDSRGPASTSPPPMRSALHPSAGVSPHQQSPELHLYHTWPCWD
ncbi:alpha/beta hydrolase family protein [Amycolatopsis sp. MEPSY49]|uniref:alpha/beta hydrolase family protein n=1 Tax=Amycolatopsis sp. MEPSY49 TaxID=3151600 RepID=UPI003EF441BF